MIDEKEAVDDLEAEFSLIEASAQDCPVEAAKQQQAEQQQAIAQSEQDRARAEYQGLFISVLGPLFQVVAPGWGVKDAEVEALAETYAEVAATYYPEGVGQLGPWPAAIMCTALVVGPRLRMPRHLVEVQPAEPAEQEGIVSAER